MTGAPENDSPRRRRQIAAESEARIPETPPLRPGLLVPMGPMIRYATESADPLEIRVYKGQDGSFTLYEDEGDSYNYETGQYAQIQLSWNDTAEPSKIGARSGSYTGMLASRTFNVIWGSAPIRAAASA